MKKQGLICSLKERIKIVLLAMIVNIRKNLKSTSSILCIACNPKTCEVEAGKLGVQGYREFKACLDYMRAGLKGDGHEVPSHFRSYR